MRKSGVHVQNEVINVKFTVEQIDHGVTNFKRIVVFGYHVVSRRKDVVRNGHAKLVLHGVRIH